MAPTLKEHTIDDSNTFYSNSQRGLQDLYGARGLADRLESMIVRETFDEQSQAFVEAADFFFLSSVNQHGFPTVSHKGGDPGFVKVTGSSTFLFPDYDGNGMYYSLGNLDAYPQVGLLFIDFENPHRVRIQGHARIVRDAQVLELWPEVANAVQVEIAQMWINCPRYIHRMQRVEPSAFVPRAGVETPAPDWKSYEPLADVVPPAAHTLNDPEDNV